MSDDQVLLRLAKLSAAAYLMTNAEVELAASTLSYALAARLVTDQCVALVCTEMVDGQIEAVVCFQGTRFAENTDIKEIWDDIDDGSIDLGVAGEVHAGFWGPMADLWPEIQKALEGAGVTLMAPITLTGHSLGGVRANLAMKLARDTGYLSVAAVSFGAPKGASRAFWQALGAAPVRLVNRCDFAPLWPPFDPRWAQPEPMQWINRQNRIETVVGWQGLFPSVGDHDIDKYIAALEAATGANLDTAQAVV